MGTTVRQLFAACSGPGIHAALIALFLVMFLLPVQDVQAVTCHCFKERTFKPAQPASADPYILATARNSLLAAASGIDKGTVVRQRMTGATETDLWLSRYLSTQINRSADQLLSARDRSSSWPAAFDAIDLETGTLGTIFQEARKAGEADGMARALADPVLGRTFNTGEATLARLRINGAVFYNDYTDMQFTLSKVEDGLQSIIVGNAAAAEMLGFELEFLAVPTERLTLTASIGYLDSEYTEVDPDADITIDNKLIGAPKWTTAISGEYSFPIEDWGDMILRADYNYRSKVYFDAVNTESVAQDGYGLVNLRAAFESADQRWVIAAGLTNATDKTYRVMGVGVLNSLGFSSAIYGRPREWFLQCSYHF